MQSKRDARDCWKVFSGEAAISVVEMTVDLGAAENAPKSCAHGVGNAEVEHALAHVCAVAKHEGEELGVGQRRGWRGDERRFEGNFVELCHR